MAKGLFQNVRYKGTIGGVTYRVVNGEYIASNKSSLSKETVSNSPAFANTRKLNNEFKGCAFFSKVLQNGLKTYAASTFGNTSPLKTYLYPDIVKIARESMNKATNQAFGERSILSANIGEAFTNFVPTKKNPDDFSSLNITLTDSGVTGSPQKVINLASFNPSTAFLAPEGATHVAVFALGAYLPNYEYNAEAGIYEPISGTTPTQEAQFSGESLGVFDLSLTTATQPATADVDVVDWEEGMRGLYLVGYGVMFMKKVGDSYVPLAGGAGAKFIYSGSWV